MKITGFFLIVLHFILLPQLFCDDNLRFDFDYGTYRYDKSTLLEIYYSFYISQLTIHSLDNNSFEIAGMLEIKIKDINTDKNILEKSYKVPLASNDSSELRNGKKLLGQINFELKPSVYNVFIIARDYYDTSKKIIVDEKIEIMSYPDDKLYSSSLQICTNIEKSDNTNSPFYKNGLDVIPNPSKLFGNNIDGLFYYIEFYNLEKISRGSYNLLYQILSNDQVINSNSKAYTVRGNTKAEYGKMDISVLSTGKYKLLITILDSSSTTLYKTDNFFWIYNSKIDTSSVSVDFNLSEYADMPENLVNDELQKIEYLLNDDFKKKVSQITSLNDKRKFLFQFWKIFEKTPNTPENEFKKQYFERITYANKNLANDFLEGWKTDRGRVYIIYGKPDDLEKHGFESGSRPFEIWHYNKLQGGVIFVFIDFSTLSGDLRLVHSTAVGELRDDNWTERLNPLR